MPHYKCAPCRVRLRVAGTGPEQVGELCPECGSWLEPAPDLNELVGFRSIELEAEPWLGNDVPASAAAALPIPPYVR